MSTLPERIAMLALATFENLPQRCKPRIHPDGRREWTPMAAIVLAIEDEISGTEVLKCVSLGTGTKCLSSSQIPKCHGLVLHDSHAEILAFRGLTRFILNEMKALLSQCGSDQVGTISTEYIELVQPLSMASLSSPVENDVEPKTIPRIEIDRRPFRFRQDVSIYMFTTVAPCGDASMELLISSSQDSTPWSTDTVQQSSADSRVAIQAQQVPLGRGYFSILGAMRRKPARGDAEMTMSKSCTDKMALKQYVGAVGFPADLLLRIDDGSGETDEVYKDGIGNGLAKGFLRGLVVYSDQFDATGYERAWGLTGRLSKVQFATDMKINANHFDTHILPPDFQRFKFEKLNPSTGSEGDKVESNVTNISTVFVASSGAGVPAVQEVLVNGVKQGYKQFEKSGVEERVGKGSVLCRRNMINLAMQIKNMLIERGYPPLEGSLNRVDATSEKRCTYADIKKSDARNWRRQVKESVIRSLRGWVSNSNEDDFDVGVW